MVVISLVRGIAAFMKSTRSELEGGASAGPSAMQKRQSQMMMARIKFQAAAIAVVIILMLAHGASH